MSNHKSNLLATVAAMCVYAHHGHLRSPVEVSKGLRKLMDFLPMQIDSITGERLSELDSICSSLSLPLFSEFRAQWRKILAEFSCIQGATHYSKYVKDSDLGLYFFVNDLFSTLIDADRLDAAGLEVPKRNLLPFEAITQKINKIQHAKTEKPDPRMEALRESIFDNLRRKAESVSLDQHVFSLTAPTGAGKTISSLYFAVKLRERKTKIGQLPRIIYVAPFLSIIDQNSQVIMDILGDLSQRSDIVLEHHHLCEMNYRTEESDYSTEQSVLLVEGWESEIVVTTFIQFLNTILGKGCKELRKLHNIAGSIIILDEVQTIPAEYWSLVREAMRWLSSSYGTTFILMTATQPLIFERSEIVELIDNYRNYFTEQKSVIDVSFFKKPDGTMTVSDFAEYIRVLLNGEASKLNLMVVMNTVDSAASLCDEFAICSSHEVRFLSAEVTPKERRERLKQISDQIKANRQDRNSVPAFLISTQLVEAGIDIDFDMVIRDLAPVDSIIQCAGRCNREGKEPRERSITRIVKLVDDDGQAFARRVYGNISIAVTEEILRGEEPSRNLNELSDRFYGDLVRSIDLGKGEEIRKMVSALDYGGLDDFQLIEERPGGSVFVELDDNAVLLFRKYLEICKLKGDERRNAYMEFLGIRSRFNEYVVNIPERYLSHLGEPINGIYHINKGDLGELYSRKGFVRKAQLKQ